MSFLKSQKIQGLYDSHVHWMYTGQMKNTWSLRGLSPDEIVRGPVTADQFRGDWVVGFGWDDSNWPADFKITSDFLDQKFPHQPVFLSRVDGHASWVNSVALKALGISGSRGHLKEKEHVQSLMKLPPFTRDQQKQHLRLAAQDFNRSGFTHIRDMTSSSSQWEMNQELLKAEGLQLHVEHWFVSESLQDVSARIAEALHCKLTENLWMKMRGIKLFVDGSLGSHTAFLSKNYSDQNHQGQMNWSELHIESALQLIWKSGLEVALHCIGDEATHRVVQVARKVYGSGLQGQLHLEHVEILRPETLQMMKPLHVRCHLQPCHWESDQIWLQSRLPELFTFAFPWAALEKARIPFSFGSDSPIEASSFFQNLQSMQKAAQKGIRPVENPMQYHIYPYTDGPQLFTWIENDTVKIQKY